MVLTTIALAPPGADDGSVTTTTEVLHTGVLAAP
jgi:hypothetical protein